MNHLVDASVKLDGGCWRIEGKPHVLFRAEKALLNAERKKDAVLVPATPEAAFEILWFSQRFNFEFGSPLKLRTDAAHYQNAQAKAKAIADNTAQYTIPASYREGMAPRHYQTQAAELWKANNGYLLADPVGLGKTLSAATAFASPELLPACVVVPTHIAMQWKEKLVEFFKDFRVHEIRMMKNYQIPKFRYCASCETWREQKMTTAGVSSSGVCSDCRLRLVGPAADPNVYIISYAKLDAWHERLVGMVKSVVYDEADQLRRFDSGKSRAARSLSARVPYRLCMTGTPIHNMGGEMWNVIECCAPGALGSKEQFRETWCDSWGADGKEPGLKDPEAFGAYLRSEHLMLRRTREEVGRELPAHEKVIRPIEANLEVLKDMTGRAASLARLVLDKSRSNVERMSSTGQLEQEIRQMTAIAKAPYVAAFVKMLLDNDEPVLLFGWHRRFYDIVMNELREYKPKLYTGSESPTQKHAAATAFINGQTNLLIVSHASGSGLDGVQKRCCRGVMGELDWTAAKMDQCSGRYFRDGQTKPCTTDYLVCDYGFDPIMAQIVAMKRDQSDKMLQVGSTQESVEMYRDSIIKLAEQLVHSNRYAEITE